MKYAIILAALLASGSAMGQNGMGSYPHGNSSGLSCASSHDICSYAGTCDANDCPEPKGTRAEVHRALTNGGITITNTPIPACPQDRELVMRSSGHAGCAADVQEPK